jgi:hypothetical protein
VNLGVGSGVKRMQNGLTSRKRTEHQHKDCRPNFGANRTYPISAESISPIAHRQLINHTFCRREREEGHTNQSNPTESHGISCCIPGCGVWIRSGIPSELILSSTLTLKPQKTQHYSSTLNTHCSILSKPKKSARTAPSFGNRSSRKS